jgi:hypothetical protein
VLGQVAHDDVSLVRVSGNPLGDLDQALSQVLLPDLREGREESKDLLVHHGIPDHFVLYASLGANLVAHAPLPLG